MGNGLVMIVSLVGGRSRVASADMEMGQSACSPSVRPRILNDRGPIAASITLLARYPHHHRQLPLSREHVGASRRRLAGGGGRCALGPLPSPEMRHDRAPSAAVCAHVTLHTDVHPRSCKPNYMVNRRTLSSRMSYYVSIKISPDTIMTLETSHRNQNSSRTSRIAQTSGASETTRFTDAARPHRVLDYNKI
ncbi:hypothetical protein EVAR_83291_1 [Eumeta japonica]|uniref:Uncharacterized protein n=1 Tax=Eumeta variegata TaxID=151549 RepID=A0A4C1X9K4_EUMVA|nr:hypothetical protein EVAR_83291_1 [Eumeta japonica]